MSFTSFSEFVAMGHHGPYVWSAYAIFIVILLGNLLSPLLARRRHLRSEARRLRREEGR